MDITLPRFNQENVLTILCFDEKNCQLVRNAITPSLFDSPYKEIAIKAIDYIDRYKIPAKQQIADELDVYIQDPKNGPIYQDILKSLFSLQENLNSKYVIDKLTKFIRDRKFDEALYDAAILQRQGKIEEAQEIMRVASQFNLTLFDPGIKLTNVDLLFESLIEEEIIPTGIKALDNMKVGLARGEIFLLLAAYSRGKAQPLSSKILTPTGWKLMGDIKIGDEIIDPDNNKAQKVIAIHPQGNKKIYKIGFSNNTSTKCTEEHLWEIRAKIGNGRELSDAFIIDTKTLLQTGLLNKDNAFKFVIPEVNKPIDFINQSKLELDPYILGLLLGDSKCVSISTEDDFILNSIKSYFKDLNVVQSKSNKFDHEIRNPKKGNILNPLISCLKTLGLMKLNGSKKFIPNIYKYASIKDRIALLQGLFDTDGNAAGSAHVDYITKSKQLAEDVREIVFSLGGKCHLSPCIKSCIYKGKKVSGKYYRLSIVFYNKEIVPFKLPRKVLIYINDLLKKSNKTFYKYITSIEEINEEEAKCITVSSPRGLYITDDYIVTHNSWLNIQIGKMAMMLGYKVVHISLEINQTKVLQRYWQNLLGMTRWQTNEVLRSPLFIRDGNKELADIKQEVITPMSLLDPEARQKVEGFITKFGPILDSNMKIKAVPAGTLTMPELRAYLDGLEQTENFIPDILILDHASQMKISEEDFRIKLGRLFVDLRGLAGTRNIAIATAHQLNKEGTKAKVADGTGVSEDWSIMGTIDTGIVYNQKPMEKRARVARITVDRGKSMKSGFTVLIAQNYDVGQFCLDSEICPNDYTPDNETGLISIPDEEQGSSED